MTTAIGADEVERFRCTIAGRLGLQFEESRLGFLGDLLRQRVEDCGRGCEAYLAGLERNPSPAELGALAQQLTVAETYFFRHMDQFRAFVELALPDRIRAQAARRRLRILSAGCASGEEAYSMAILVRGVLTDPAWELSIRGIDLNPAMPAKAERARYSIWALRETPPEVQRRWFRQEGGEVVLEEAARRLVTFETRNLLDEDGELWQPGDYDVVFCRNVIMYFTPEAARAVVARIARALAPGGYLFLGHAETLRALSQDFHLRHTHGTFYYQRKAEAELAAVTPAPAVAPRSASAPLLANVVENADAWVDTIRKTAERIQALAQVSMAGAPAGATHGPTLDLGLALDLLGEERFADALGLIRALPPESERDPDVMLLEAVLLVHSGQLALAEEACLELLGIDELSAGAHYLLALCREGAGDRPGAAEHDRVAVYLDSTLAMPRLHLGLLARRAGDQADARRELGQALYLLEREDASRLLLFGGGFQREALMDLCRAELRACGR